MSVLRNAPGIGFIFALMFASGSLRAQSTDAYHAIQVLPVVVDTASFTQQFSLYNASPSLAVGISPTYYPAQGTGEPASTNCPGFVLNPASDKTFGSLRQVCPSLAAGSMFGTLVFSASSTRTFAVYSRVSNAAGSGFSVEAFPANAFSTAITMVTGLRRSSATPSQPAFQSNCFVGNLGQLTPSALPATADVTLTLRKSGVLIGSTVVSLPPGKLVRLLDVFSAVGQPSGDFENVTAEFTAGEGQRAGVLSFCTVQDNTSFGADFRIGKQEQGSGVAQTAFDVTNMRDVVIPATPSFNGTAVTWQVPEIPAGATANTHVLYFRHPDYISCAVWGSGVGAAEVDYGLEMRLLAYINGTDTWEVIAGGNDVTSFSDLYLGDKEDRGNGGNTTYYLQVESNGRNEGVSRKYALRCQSGSGHTFGELIQSGAPVSF